MIKRQITTLTLLTTALFNVTTTHGMHHALERAAKERMETEARAIVNAIVKMAITEVEEKTATSTQNPPEESIEESITNDLKQLTTASEDLKAVAPRRTKSDQETKKPRTINNPKKPSSHPRALKAGLPPAPQLHQASPDSPDFHDENGYLQTAPLPTLHAIASKELTKKRALTPVPQDKDTPKEQPARSAAEATILQNIKQEKSLSAVNSWYRTSFNDKDLDSLTQHTKELFKAPFADIYYLLIILKESHRSYPLLFNIAGEWVYHEDSRLESFIQLTTGKTPTITRKADTRKVKKQQKDIPDKDILDDEVFNLHELEDDLDDN